jgi:hypothetical protein
MSERPTPETEKIKGALHTNWDNLLAHARKLERERDEAREALASREVVLAQQRVITDLMLERDQARAVLQEIEAARWHTACELRRIATRALGNLTIPTK